MKKLNLTALVVLLALAGVGLTVHAADDEAARNMKAFPPAEAGMTRFVVQLPKQKDEDSFRVELIVGKTARLDAVNRYFLGGKIEAVNIEGWGFTRYVVEKLGPMGGTLMAPDPAAPQMDRFVAIGGEPYFVRYNSRLPIVVYAPNDAEVRYRIWTAGPEVKVAPEGAAATRPTDNPPAGNTK
jgi:ecotin